MIQVNRVGKRFENGGPPVHVLRDVQLEVRQGEFIAVMGPSGSGKSTLLQLIGGIEQPTEGEVVVNGAPLHKLNERERTLLRRRQIGMVFQNYQLLPILTVEENVAFPLHTDRVAGAEVRARVASLLSAVGLADEAKRFPAQLSGGQQQRAAIARALVMRPRVVLADEPTGNLDRKSGNDVLQLLSRLHREERLTVIMVTHDIYAAGYAERIVTLRDGRIVESVERKEDEGHVLMENFLAKFDA